MTTRKRDEDQSVVLPSRRAVLKSAALLGVGAGLLDPADAGGQTGATAALGERLLRANRDPNRRILVRGGSIEAVWVAGQLRRWDRSPVGYDLPKIHQQGNASRDYLFKAVGRSFDRLFQ